MIKIITAFLLSLFRDLFMQLKIYIANYELNKQIKIAKEKTNEATKAADDFLSKYESYVRERRNMRQSPGPVRISSEDSTRGDNGTK
mgnify:CR=1 FL=1